MKKSNPPAFPSSTSPSMHGAWGMTLRDYFAAAALPAVIAHIKSALVDDGMTFDLCEELDSEMVALECYAAADAMLAVRDFEVPILSALERST